MKLQGLSLLIKPASSLCNMRCRYCFYTDEAAHRMQASCGLMSMETASRLIRSALDEVDPRGVITFAFQGGEPTLAGLDFFRSFCAAVDRLNLQRTQIRYSIQTNGLGLSAEWAAFFHDRGFLVGLSVDGYGSLHDAYRVDAASAGTYDRCLTALKLLQQHRVETNLLCVVNSDTAASPKRVYRALKELGTGWLQFIPCLDPLDVPPGSMPWSLTPEAWGRFLCGTFDLWYKDLRSGQYVSIRQFEDWIRMAAGLPPDTCASCGACGSYLVAEANGDLYPCDFYALDEWKLGTACQPLSVLLASQRMNDFRLRSRKKPAACSACRWYGMCRGGCPRDWYSYGEQIQNRFCAAYRMLFEYAGERMLALATTMKRNNR